jgi:alpha-D-xyloside xylohydrolase
MFGPAFLVSPVRKPDADKRDVYLPSTPAWYDFWSGEKIAGRGELVVSAPLDRIPLFMRAGSIVPLGPEIEYAGEQPAGPIELRVYRGADGTFDFYQDEGDSYRYERGAYSVIPIHWNDASATLTLGERAGSFQGMPEHIAFRVILVSRGHGVGERVSPGADATVDYAGKKIELKLAPR